MLYLKGAHVCHVISHTEGSHVIACAHTHTAMLTHALESAARVQELGPNRHILELSLVP